MSQSLNKKLNMHGINHRERGVDHFRLRLECTKRDLVIDPQIATALDQLSVNPYDFECAQFVLQRIGSYDLQETLNPDPFRKTNPSRYSNVDGPIKLGRVIHSNIPWGIKASALTEHMVIVGRTGGGKTTVIKNILSQLLSRRVK